MCCWCWWGVLTVVMVVAAVVVSGVMPWLVLVLVLVCPVPCCAGCEHRAKRKFMSTITMGV